MGRNAQRRRSGKTAPRSLSTTRILDWWTWKEGRPKRTPYLWTADDIKSAVGNRLKGGDFLPSPYVAETVVGFTTPPQVSELGVGPALVTSEAPIVRPEAF